MCGDASPTASIAPEDYEAVRDDLAQRLAEIPDDEGRPMATQVYKPEELYAEVNGVAPDLIVVFGDLLWRSVATIGGDEGVHTLENDTGPGRREPRAGRDDRRGGRGRRPRAAGSTRTCSTSRRRCSSCWGMDVPADMRGRSLGPKLAA